jgi:hypothetical protein
MGNRRGAYRVFVGGDLKDRGHLEDEGVDRRIILKWIKRWDVGIDLVELAQDRDRDTC